MENIDKFELTDDYGNTIEFEKIDETEYNETVYYLLKPEEEDNVYIFKLNKNEDEEFSLAEVTDEVEFAVVSQIFAKKNNIL